MSLIAVVRIRGKVKVSKEHEDTLKMLNLTRVNHCALHKDSAALRGMLKKVQGYITWGPISDAVLRKLLKKRARLEGDTRISEEWLKEKGLDWDKLIEMFKNDPKDVYKLGIKKVFRLSPPSKGFERKGIKVPFKVGGALGDRGEKINELLLKMI